MYIWGGGCQIVKPQLCSNCSVLARLKIIIFHKNSTSKAAKILQMANNHYFFEELFEQQDEDKMSPPPPSPPPPLPSWLSLWYAFSICKICWWQNVSMKNIFIHLKRISDFLSRNMNRNGIVRNLSRARSEFLPWREISRKSLLEHCVTNTTKQTSICDVLCHNHH